jgi:hypothetical protein
VQPEPRHDLDKMILHPEVKTDILAGLRALEIRADLDRIWNLSSIQPQQGRCILNFYGPPDRHANSVTASFVAHRTMRCSVTRLCERTVGRRVPPLWAGGGLLHRLGCGAGELCEPH